MAKEKQSKGTSGLHVSDEDRITPPAGDESPPAKKPRAKKKPRGSGKSGGKSGARRSLASTLVLYALTACVWVGLAAGLTVGYFMIGLPDIDEGALTRRPNIMMVDADGAEIASVGDIYRGAVKLSELPAYVPGAMVSVEDRRFYSHFGVDPLGLIRAVSRNFGAGRAVQGGSTITQQIAKNLFLTPERTITRKIREALLAVKLERAFTKDQILTIYLNRVYLGGGTYGVEAASERYFGRPAKEMSVFQAAVLAGLLRAPSRYSPNANPELAATRAAVVLQTMVETGIITPAVAKNAQADGAKNLRATAAASAQTRGRYFVDWILSQVDGFVGTVDRDLIITTTIDMRLQRVAEATLEKTLAASGAKLKVEQGAITVMSTDGAVRVMVGGRDYNDSQFNRVTQALRQPGSSFKPIVFLAGLEAGYKPDDMVTDAPITIGKWTPKNFSKTFEGPVTMETALAKSLNTATVRIAQQAGAKAVVAMAHRLGITQKFKPDLSLALGSGEVTLLELAGAYAPFANGGEAVMPYGIEAVTDRAGKVLYRHEPGTLGQVIPMDEVAMMNRMMTQVMLRGTGTAASFGFPAAGKTGTSSDFRDAWFMGFTSDYVAGVWVGNDSGADMKGVTGGAMPAHIWHDVMVAAHEGRTARDLPGLGTSVMAAQTSEESRGGLERLIDNVFGSATSAQ